MIPQLTRDWSQAGLDLGLESWNGVLIRCAVRLALCKGGLLSINDETAEGAGVLLYSVRLESTKSITRMYCLFNPAVYNFLSKTQSLKTQRTN